MSTIDLQGLGVAYGKRRVLADVGLRVEPGEVYALLGRNGAGKSSLVRCLLGWQRPSAGSARLFGQDAWRTRAQAMARVGVVPESPDLPPRRTLAELADFCAPLYPTFDRAGLDAALERAGIPMRARTGSLSRGQKAQAALALALALAPRPDLLVLDDPTLGLDAVARRAFFEALVVDLADRGVTVLLTTHDLAGAEGVADRVGILHGGHLLRDQPLEALKAGLRRLRWTDDEPDLAGLEVLRRTSDAFGGEAIVDGWTEEHRLAGVQAESLSLEEAFIALTHEGEEVRP
jgi:ABC-2 type transport system ATP-binding protein